MKLQRFLFGIHLALFDFDFLIKVSGGPLMIWGGARAEISRWLFFLANRLNFFFSILPEPPPRSLMVLYAYCAVPQHKATWKYSMQDDNSWHRQMESQFIFQVSLFPFWAWLIIPLGKGQVKFPRYVWMQKGQCPQKIWILVVTLRGHNKPGPKEK